MAQAITVDARLVKVWKGVPSGGGSTLVCALVTRAFNQTKQSNTAVIPDCADPTVVAPVKRTILSKDATITGTGYYEPDKRNVLQTDFDDEVSHNWAFEIPAAAPNGGYYMGKFFLNTFNITAEEGNFVQAEMTWEADGPVSWVAYP
jgi:hypothetical protein